MTKRRETKPKRRAGAPRKRGAAVPSPEAAATAVVEDGAFWFDEAAADRACRFFEKYLRHWKGEWAGQPFVLEPWQRDVVRRLFGWKHKHKAACAETCAPQCRYGLRRYRRVFIFVPRKNGKSTFAAGLGLLLLLADGEAGAEIYSAAADRGQAAIVFSDAKAMVEASLELSERCELFTRTIVAPRTGSKYEVISADARRKHGFNSHAILFDELHAQTSRELWDVLTTSTGARRQPVVIAISTAGFDRHSICFEIYEYACKVRDGIIEDPEFLPVIYEATAEDDWTSPDTWRRANPSLGAAVKFEYLEKECQRAKETPAYENTFRQLHLNQWTENAVRWLPIAKWDESALDAEGKLVEVTEGRLRAQVCWSALDLSSTIDITALVHCFQTEDGDLLLLPRFWIPEDNMRVRSRRDRVPYEVWVKQGLIQATAGDVIDYDFIKAQVLADAKAFEIREVAFDPYNAQHLVKELMDEGLNLVEFPQNFRHIGPATKDFMTEVIAGRVKHGGNPVLRWMAGNLMLRKDANGNLRPDKERSIEKIDGMVASIMAVDRAKRNEPPANGPSKYEAEELLVL